MIRNLTVALAGASLLAATAPQAAEAQRQTIGVSIADLDLNTKEGRDELSKRIDDAAKKVCGLEAAGTGSRVTNRDARKCYNDAHKQMEEHFAEIVESRQLGG